MKFEEIHTERLILRKISEDTYHELFKHYSDQDIKLFLGLSSDEALEKEKIKYKSGGMSTYNKKILYFQLLDKVNQSIIGWCGFHTWYIDHYRAEIGYGLYDDSYKRKGLMTEAIQPVVAYGFNQMNLHRIEALVAPYNEPSLKLIQKLNFKKEGVLKQHYLVDGKHEDSVIYGLLKPNFR